MFGVGVTLLRPGGGDPSGFDVNDCSTQRVLDAAGRQQSTDVGAAFASAFAAQRAELATTTYTSQWRGRSLSARAHSRTFTDKHEPFLTHMLHLLTTTSTTS